VYHYPDSFTTERLITRKLQFEDYNPWTRFLEDKKVVRFFPNVGDMGAEDRAKMWMEKALQRYRDKEYGLHALLDKNTGEFIGQCGLLSQEVDGRPELEVGYHLFPEYWGKGYATEAATFFRDFAFNNSLSNSIISIIHTENLPSQKVAGRNGMSREKETLWKNLKVFIFRVNYEQWQKSRL